jgi:hypothetical protein
LVPVFVIVELLSMLKEVKMEQKKIELGPSSKFKVGLKLEVFFLLHPNFLSTSRKAWMEQFLFLFYSYRTSLSVERSSKGVQGTNLKPIKNLKCLAPSFL